MLYEFVLFCKIVQRYNKTISVVNIQINNNVKVVLPHRC